MLWKKHRQFHFLDSKSTFHFTSTRIMICLLLWSLKATLISCGKRIFCFLPFYIKFDIPWINFFQKTSHKAPFEYFLMYLVNSKIRAPPPVKKEKMLISGDYVSLSLFSTVKCIVTKGLNWGFIKTKAKRKPTKEKKIFLNSWTCLPRNMAICQTKPPSNTHTIRSDLQSNFFRASTCAQLMNCRTWNLLSLNFLCFFLGNLLSAWLTECPGSIHWIWQLSPLPPAVPV